MGQIDRVTIKKELPVPFDEGDEEREEIIEQLISAKNREVELKIEIEPLNEELKEVKKEIEEGVKSLRAGKIVNVDCEQKIDWDEASVTIKRLDTDDVIQTRSITEEDRQLHIGLEE